LILSQSLTKGKAQMTCHNCSSLCKKLGKFGPQRIQRYRCNKCKRTFSEQHEKLQGPLGDMRISLDKAETCLKLMLEGMSVPSIQRITGVHQKTILDLLVLAGQKAERIMNEKIKGIAVKDVEADEIWGFVQMGRPTKIRKGLGIRMLARLTRSSASNAIQSLCLHGILANEIRLTPKHSPRN
jgi:transposase-like protein